MHIQMYKYSESTFYHGFAFKVWITFDAKKRERERINYTQNKTPIEKSHLG